MCIRRFLIICILLVMIWLILAFDASAEGLTLYAAHEEGTLNIRESPYGERVGYLLPGDEAEFVKQADGWVFVKLGIESGGGWVKADYLTIDPEGAGQYLNASGGRVRIRKAPGGDTAGWLADGAKTNVLSILPDEGGELWGRTEKGYIQMKWLERVNDNEQTQVRQP